VSNFRIARIDPRYTPQWPRTPWPSLNFREAMQSPGYERLARRIHGVWAHPDLSDNERALLFLFARKLTQGDWNYCEPGRERNYRNFVRAEAFASRLEQKYGEPVEANPLV
jgi:hypothetical protein